MGGRVNFWQLMSFVRKIVSCGWCALLATAARAQSTLPVVTQPIPAQSLMPGGQFASLDMRQYFSVPGVSGQIVQFDTVLGAFDVELRPDAAPQNVANFMAYVKAGSFRNTLFERATSLDGGAISTVQGGGYTVLARGDGSVAAIPKNTSAPSEYSLANVRGTLAAANSATSEWFFNLRDNTTALGPSNGAYTVFGRVLGTGMSVIDAVAALPRVNVPLFPELPVRNYTAGQVMDANYAVINSITPVPLYATGNGPALLTFSVLSSAPSVVTANISGFALTLVPMAEGNASVTVRATDPNGNVAETTFAVAVANKAPVFTAQPTAQTIATGASVVLTATAAGAATYQWERNGVDIRGATGSSLLISNASGSDAGTYTVAASNAVSTSMSAGASVAVVATAPQNAGRLVNLAIRTNAGTGAQTLIVGFVVGGAGTSGSKPLLARGVGPSLAQYGVTNSLGDPVETMYRSASAIMSNDDWSNDPTITERSSEVGAFPLLPSSADAAMALTVAPDSYTAQVTGKANATGIALAEIYDATNGEAITGTSPRLINVSARAQVGTGADILIAGFVIGGTTAKTVLIRAIGPTLETFGVSGALADPKLQLYSGANLLRENNDWGGDPQLTAVGNSVGAFALPSGATKDAALLVTLPPGGYTAQVSGADGGTGVALVEVYEVP